ncbi:hypothetical protein D092_16735 [Rhodococcus ruber Chol-4]|nr:hypothetical protein D092_16735 [Rhodococcus ruber Chol-4]
MHSFSRRSRRRSLPRGGLLQGMICGITAAIGYGPGRLAAFMRRAFADRSPRRPRSGCRRAFFIGAGPSPESIGRFADRPAMEPIRTCAGLTPAVDSESRAALAVEGLTRAGVSSATIRSW